MTQKTYSRPELVEIGDAEKMTLGCTGSNKDNCKCAQCFEDDPCPEIEVAT